VLIGPCRLHRAALRGPNVMGGYLDRRRVLIEQERAAASPADT